MGGMKSKVFSRETKVTILIHKVSHIVRAKTKTSFHPPKSLNPKLWFSKSQSFPQSNGEKIIAKS